MPPWREIGGQLHRPVLTDADDRLLHWPRNSELVEDFSIRCPPTTLPRVRAHAGSTAYSAFKGVPLVAGLIVQQLSQADHCRGGENVTDMLYREGLPVRSRTYNLVNTLTSVTSHAWSFGAAAFSKDRTLRGARARRPAQ